MIHALTAAVQSVLVERLTLLLNHVLGAELPCERQGVRVRRGPKDRGEG